MHSRAFGPRPLRFSRLDIRPVHAVFGYSPEQVEVMLEAQRVERLHGNLAWAEQAVADARDAYVDARRAIGEANRGVSCGLYYPKANAWQRRSFRSIAFRKFNVRLRELRAAEKRLAEAQAAVATLAH